MSPLEIWGKIILIPFFIVYILFLSTHRYSKRATLLLSFLIVASYTLLTYTIIWNFYYLIDEYPILDMIYRYGNLIVMVFIATLLTRQRMAKTVFITLSVLVSISAVGVLAMAALQYTGMHELPTRIVLYMMLSFLFFAARKHFLEVMEHAKKGLWVLCSIPLFLIVTFLFVTAVPMSLERNPANMPSALILCSTTLVIYTVLVFILKLMYRESQLELNIVSLHRFVTALEQQRDITVNNAQKIAIFRHDLRHALQLIRTCLDNDDIPGVRKLLCGLDNNINDKAVAASILPVTGYKLLDATLSCYMDIAREADIEFRMNLSGIEKGIRVNSDELAMTMSNALENAINACRLLPDGAKKAILIEGHWKGAQYFIEIINTCAGEVLFDPVTGLPISEEEGHGYGSQSIAYFANKYGIILQYRLESGMFHLRMLI